MTRFESYALNTMIDLVEAGNPQALAGAAEALGGVRKAFQEAARELRGHLGAVEWKGESGTEFRRFGGRLAEHADDLGTYASLVGAHLTEAATGLTVVRSAMPPRAPAAGTGLPPSEPHRQEAINQLNRLASYYAVTGANLAAEEPPRFEEKLDAAVPRPAAGGGAAAAGGSQGPTATAGNHGGTGYEGTGWPTPAPTPTPTTYAPHVTYDTAGDPAGTSSSPRTGHAPTPPPAAVSPNPPTTTMELNSVTPPTLATTTVAAASSGIPTPAVPQLTPPLQPLPPVAAFPGPLGGISGGMPLTTPANTAPHTPASGITGRAATGGTATGRNGPRQPFTAGMPGVVGGSPVRGVPTPRTGTGGGPFTQGGAGLLRPAPPAMAPAPRTPQGSKPSPSRPRPRHLTEDEETWTAGRQTPVPPVVHHPPH
ncbi:hypothetical protein [Streptomyces sp. NPDC048442]|uniref:hypothetical protein n=1 Tax=Streptomyces sp. NPDC048442 TaxID=3154823 RepID=UPI00343F6CE2